MLLSFIKVQTSSLSRNHTSLVLSNISILKIQKPCSWTIQDVDNADTKVAAGWLGIKLLNKFVMKQEKDGVIRSRLHWLI